MLVVRALTDVDVAAAELDQPLDRFLLVVERRGRQVEMEAVHARSLRLRDRRELDLEPRAIGRHETDHVTGRLIGLVVDVPAQRLGPEARQTVRIVRIEAQGHELTSHFGTSTRSLRMADTSEGHRSELWRPSGRQFVSRSRWASNTAIASSGVVCSRRTAIESPSRSDRSPVASAVAR